MGVLRGQQEGGGGQLLWPVMATEGASQSDFVPVTTGDLLGCLFGHERLGPQRLHHPTLGRFDFGAVAYRYGCHTL